MENMNKVDAPCRPATSLKFTIDNILNLKTSGRDCDSCDPNELHDDTSVGMRKDGFQSHREEHEQRQSPGGGLHKSGKRGLGIYALMHVFTVTHELDEVSVCVWQRSFIHNEASVLLQS